MVEASAYTLPEKYQKMHEEVLDAIRTESVDDSYAIWEKNSSQVYENEDIPKFYRRKLEKECMEAIDEKDDSILEFTTHTDSI